MRTQSIINNSSSLSATSYQDRIRGNLIIRDLKSLLQEDYLEFTRIEEWFENATVERLSQCNAGELCYIIEKIVVLNIYNDDFIKSWIESCKVNEFSPSQLLIALQSLNTLKYDIPSEFIRQSVNNFSRSANLLSKEECTNLMLLLTKFEYRDEAFLNQLARKIITNNVNNSTMLVNSLHAAAKLDYHDPNLIGYLINNIDKYVQRNDFDQRKLVNTAFYLAMIKVNSADQFPAIEPLINKIMNRIDYSKPISIESKYQLLQIKAAGINVPHDMNNWDEQVKENVRNNVTESYTQIKVQKELKNYFAGFCAVDSEVWFQAMASSIDVRIKYQDTGAIVAVQVDGPRHWYSNERPLLSGENISDIKPNATTRFNTAIAGLQSIRLFRINYIQADNNRYLKQVDGELSSLNETILNQKNAKASAQTGVSVTSSSSGADIKKEKTKAKDKKSKNKKASSISTEDDDWAFLDSIARPPEEILKEKLKERLSTPQYIKETHDDIINGNYEAIKLRLEEWRRMSSGDFLTFVREPHQSNTKKGNRSKSFIELAIFELDKNLTNENNEHRQNIAAGIQDRSNSSPRNDAYLKIVELLINNGAELNLRDVTHGNIVNIYLLALKEEKYFSLFKAFLDKMPESENKKQLKEYSFINSAFFDNLKVMNYFLKEEGISHNTLHFNQILASMQNCTERAQVRAAIEGQLAAALFDNRGKVGDIFGKFNMQKNVPLDKIGQGMTALHVAADNGNLRPAKVLLDYGVNVNTLNARGQNPFFSAITWKHEELAELFLEHNPNLNVIDFYDQTILFIACCNGFKKVVKHIIENTTNIDFPSKISRSTPLVGAIHNHNNKIAELLIEVGANLEAKILDEGEEISIAKASIMVNNDQACIMLMVATASDRLFKEIIDYDGTDRVFERQEDADTYERLKKAIAALNEDPIKFIIESKVSPVIKAMGLKNLSMNDPAKEEQINDAFKNLLASTSEPDQKEKINQIKESTLMKREEVVGKYLARLEKETNESRLEQMRID